jgi:hypothetical protein
MIMTWARGGRGHRHIHTFQSGNGRQASLLRKTTVCLYLVKGTEGMSEGRGEAPKASGNAESYWAPTERFSLRQPLYAYN